jgi:hypothetical protein
MPRHQWTILPPRPNHCQHCAVQHDPLEPHNPESFYYQMRFYQEQGRLPTWADALAHCPSTIQAQWQAELAKRGIIV